MAHVYNVMLVQTEDGILNEIRSGDTRTQSIACWKCGEVRHFHTVCFTFDAQAQSADNVDTTIGQMSHKLTASSPIRDMVLKSILKELLSAKVTKILQGEVLVCQSIYCCTTCNNRCCNNNQFHTCYHYYHCNHRIKGT